MKKLLPLLLLSCLASPANAWLAQVPAVGASYVGVLDVYSTNVIDCWGFRACSAAIAAANGALFDLRDALNTTTTTIHAVAGGGYNTTELATSGCTTLVAACHVVKAYGQVNGIACQETTFASQPIFDPDGLASGKPALYSPAAAGTALQCGSISTATQPWTMAITIKPITTPGANNRVFNYTDPTGILYNSSGFALFAGGLSSSATAAAGSYYAVVGVADSSSSVLNINGSETTGLNPSTGSLSSTGNILGTGIFQDGRVADWVAFDSGADATARGNIGSNMKTYGGF